MLVEIRDTALKSGGLCDHCLGRLVSLKFKGMPCERIGAALRAAKSDADVAKGLKRGLKPHKGECAVCQNLFLKLGDWDRKLKEAAKKEDFKTFLVGSRLNPAISDAEDGIWAKTGMEYCEPLKRELNRLLGSRLEEATKKKAEFNFPDVVFLADFTSGKVSVRRNSLFIFGRYKKFERGLPQTKWPCRECGGKGCAKCNNTGKQFLETVEELVAEKVLEATGGKGSRFHGVGREDRDARMLGTGRPFVLEIMEPRKRTLPLRKLEAAINKFAKGKVEVKDLRPSNKGEVQYLKSVRWEKTYDALVECEQDITPEDLAKLEEYFTERELHQRTPKRVLHRRADRVRRRRVISMKCTPVSARQFRAIVKAEAGTYIKELITGDDRRTKPSVSIILRKPCVCKELDVIAIHEVKE